MKTKIYKLLSILLTVTIVFSACLCAFGTVAAEETTLEYYVSNSGSDETEDGTTLATAFYTVGAAVTKALSVEGFNVAGNVLTVNVENTIGSGVYLWGTVPAHNFTLKLVGLAENTRVQYNADNHIILGGPTELYDIHFIPKLSAFNYELSNKDVTFGEGTKVNVDRKLYIGTKANANVSTSQTIKFNGVTNSTTSPISVYLANRGISVAYNAPINITTNNSSFYPKFLFGNANSSYTTTYNSLINFDIKDITAIEFGTANGTYSFGDGAAIQVMNSSGKTIALPTLYKNSTDTSVEFEKIWILNNTSDYKDALSFTETAGTFAVDTTVYSVTATNGTSTVNGADGELVLGVGTWNITISRITSDYNYTVGTGGTYATIAEAIAAANTAGAAAGDDVTVQIVGTDAVMYLADGATAPAEHGFRLTITSSQTGATVNFYGRKAILGDTIFENVKITSTDNATNTSGSNDNYLFLDGKNVTFEENVTLAKGARWVYTGTYNSGKTYTENQRVTLKNECSSSVYITTGDQSAIPTYNSDITIDITNSASSPTVRLSANSIGRNLNGNININLSNGATLNSLNNNVNVTVGKALNIVTESSISDTLKQKINAVTATNGIYIFTNETGRTNIITATDIAGEYLIVSDVDVIAIGSNGEEVKSSSGILVLGAGEWNLTTGGIFENFNSITTDDFIDAWNVKGDIASVANGKLTVTGKDNALASGYIIKNLEFNSKNQFISVDAKGSNYNSDKGAAIFARMGTEGSYRLMVTGGIIRLHKRNNSDGNASATYDEDGTFVSGIDKDLYVGQLPNVHTNTFTFCDDNTYRLAISVVDDTAENSTVAYIRVIVLDVTTNTLIFDETFKDTARFEGTTFGIGAMGKDTTTEFDNLYYSSKCFKGGDEGSEKGDINRDGVYDIRDLDYLNKYLNDSSVEVILNIADKNYDGVVTQDDLDIISSELLNGGLGEFGYAGQQDNASNTLRQEILGSASGIINNLDGTYTYNSANNNGVTVSADNEIYYVSSDAVGGNNGISPDTPWTLTELNSNYESLKEGDAVLFKRGSVFRLEGGYQSRTMNGTNRTYYAYVIAKAGVTYGAYGMGNKPLFKDSAKDYTVEGLWSETAEGSNIWKCTAPEIIIDATVDQEDGRTEAVDNSATNIIFDGGKSVGVRREYLEDLHTIYKNGYFTYDEASGTLYLYCDKGNPADVYDSIEVCRGLYGFLTDSNANNIMIDNLAFQGFAAGAINGLFKNSGITITNCEIGFSGGIQSSSNDNLFLGNAVGFWNGGANSIVSHNWIYQTFDSAISPQGDLNNISYDNFTVVGNLLEYNNCDIEFFGVNSTYNNWNISGNMMRFTSLGWGSRQSEVIRGIQGVVRARFEKVKYGVVDFDFTNNIIDSPGMEIFNIDNAVTTKNVTYNKGTTTNPTTATTNVITDIYRFGDDGYSTFTGNSYYFNPYIRASIIVVRDYKTAVADYVSAIDENNAVLYEENSPYYTVDESGNITFNIYKEAADKCVTGNDGKLVSFLQLVDSTASVYWFSNQAPQAE